MKRKAIAAVAVALTMIGVGVGPVDARRGPAEPQEGPPVHGHVLLLGVNEAELTYRKCVDLKPVPLRAHHSSVHTGRASYALARAGHMVVPTSDIGAPPGVLPENCADVDAWIAGFAD